MVATVPIASHPAGSLARRPVALLSALIALVATAGCVGAPEDNRICTPGAPSRERYGTDCPCCHVEFGVAGSLDVDGPTLVQVVVTDAQGLRAVMVRATGLRDEGVHDDQPLWTTDRRQAL